MLHGTVFLVHNGIYVCIKRQGVAPVFASKDIRSIKVTLRGIVEDEVKLRNSFIEFGRYQMDTLLNRVEVK